MPLASDESSASPAALTSDRLKQSERRARTREALMVATAQNITKYGYAELKLESIASDAGYTRGALYHLFASKEDLVLAVVEWVSEAWADEAGHLLYDETDPVGALVAVAKAYATFSRHEVPRVLTRLGSEFTGTDHPVERVINGVKGEFCEFVVRLVTAGRTSGAIPPGPPGEVMAIAYMGAIDGVVRHLGGHAPFDALFAERAASGVLGLPSASGTKH